MKLLVNLIIKKTCKILDHIMQVHWSLNQLTVVENGEILNKASGSENGQIIHTSNLYYRQIAVYKYEHNFFIFKNLPR